MAAALNIHQSARAVPSRIEADIAIKGAQMKPVNRIARIGAAATALSVTFALVWSMAHLGYPGAAEMPIQMVVKASGRAG